MRGSNRNFGFSFVGDVHQAIVNTDNPSEFGLPQPTEPLLSWFSLDDAFEDGQLDIFSALRWDYNLVTELYGRSDELNAIVRWAERGGNTAAVRLVTGEGGSGKTRLAAEAAKQLRDKGWTAGFLPREDKFLFKVNSGGLFLICDYPEEQAERARKIFQKLADLKTAPFPIRILLLSRQSFSRWEAEGDILEGRFGQQAVAAPRELSVTDATRMFYEALHNLGGVAQSGVSLQDQPDLARWLNASPIHRLPLFVAAAAIHTFIAPGGALNLDGAALLHSLVRRERRRIRKVSQSLGLGTEGLGRLLALAVIGGGLTQNAIHELIAEGVCDTASAPPMEAAVHSPCYREGSLICLQPDRPATAFLDETLFGPDLPQGDSRLPNWLFIAIHHRWGENRLGRILYDLDTLDSERKGPHPLNYHLIRMLEVNPDRAKAFADLSLMGASISISYFAGTVAVMVANSLGKFPQMKAVYLQRGASYCSSVGLYDDAITLSLEAVKVCRKLVRTRPGKYKVDLATSVNNLGAILSEAGRQLEAVELLQEAISIRRGLVNVGSGTSRADLAISLNNFAACLSELERNEDALLAAEESVALRRELATVEPDVPSAGLANALNNLGLILSKMNRKEALTISRETVELYRTLSRDRPEEYTGDLAMALHNLSARYLIWDESLEGIQAAQEAVQLYINLARTQPNAHNSHLLSALLALLDCLMREDMVGEALSVKNSAMTVYLEFGESISVANIRASEVDECFGGCFA